MSQNSDSSSLEDSPSRRKFLKVSAVAGAAAAATVVAGAHFLSASNALQSTSTKGSSELARGSPIKASSRSSSAFSGDQRMFVVVKGNALEIYRGMERYEVRDESFASFFTSAIRGKIAQE